MKSRITYLFVLMVLGSVAILRAEEGQGEERSVESLLKNKDFLDSCVNIQVQNMKDQYNLTPEQVKQVRQFIRKEDIRSRYKAAGEMEKFDRSMRKKMESGEELTVQDLRDVQDGAEKLYPLSKKIFKSMMMQTLKIQSILTEEQKKAFKKEVDELELNAAELTNRLERWRAGDIKIEELKEQFGPPKEDEPGKDEAEKDPELKMYNATSYDYWELYVKTFIEAFELDKGQRTMAYSVLGDMKQRADTYRKDHAGEYAEAQKNIAELRRYKISDKVGGRNVMEVLAERKKRLEDIDKPLMDMFEELKQRLMKIPTDQQRKRALDLIGGGDERKKGGK